MTLIDASQEVFLILNSGKTKLLEYTIVNIIVIIFLILGYQADHYNVNDILKTTDPLSVE
jgi:hypothetical protein